MTGKVTSLVGEREERPSVIVNDVFQVGNDVVK